jgi:hypothetical protein
MYIIQCEFSIGLPSSPDIKNRAVRHSIFNHRKSYYGKHQNRQKMVLLKDERAQSLLGKSPGTGRRHP